VRVGTLGAPPCSSPMRPRPRSAWAKGRPSYFHPRAGEVLPVEAHRGRSACPEPRPAGPDDRDAPDQGGCRRHGVPAGGLEMRGRAAGARRAGPGFESPGPVAGPERGGGAGPSGPGPGTARIGESRARRSNGPCIIRHSSIRGPSRIRRRCGRHYRPIEPTISPRPSNGRAQRLRRGGTIPHSPRPRRPDSGRWYLSRRCRNIAYGDGTASPYPSAPPASPHPR
jgi:hypothetical protein